MKGRSGYGGHGGYGQGKGMPQMYGPVENRVYVSNLPWDIAWQELKDHMKSVGDVIYADLFTEGGRSKGCALVSFKSPEEARRAVLELHDSDLGGRKIIVREDRVDQLDGHAKDCRVYVGNLSWQATWKDLKDLCRTVGEVKRADVVEDVQGRSRGFGIVEFATAAEAQAAVEQLSGSDLKGRTIFVREDREVGRPLQPSEVWKGSSKSSNAYSYGNGYNEGYTKVFVGNLPYTVTWQTLKDSMRQWGDVVHVELFTEGGDPQGRSKGCGVVEFSTYGAAKRAVRYMHDTMMEGRLMYVREYYDEAKGQGSSVQKAPRPKFRVKAHHDEAI